MIRKKNIDDPYKETKIPTIRMIHRNSFNRSLTFESNNFFLFLHCLPKHWTDLTQKSLKIFWWIFKNKRNVLIYYNLPSSSSRNQTTTLSAVFFFFIIILVLLAYIRLDSTFFFIFFYFLYTEYEWRKLYIKYLVQFKRNVLLFILFHWWFYF